MVHEQSMAPARVTDVCFEILAVIPLDRLVIKGADCGLKQSYTLQSKVSRPMLTNCQS